MKTITKNKDKYCLEFKKKHSKDIQIKKCHLPFIDRCLNFYIYYASLFFDSIKYGRSNVWICDKNIDAILFN